MDNREFYLQAAKIALLCGSGIAGYFAIDRHVLHQSQQQAQTSDNESHYRFVTTVWEKYTELPPQDVGKRRALVQLISMTARDPYLKQWAEKELQRRDQDVRRTLQSLKTASDQAEQLRKQAAHAEAAARDAQHNSEARQRLETAAARSEALAQQAEHLEREWARRLEVPPKPETTGEFRCVRSPGVHPQQVRVVASSGQSAVQQCWDGCRGDACSVLDVIDSRTGQSVQTMGAG